MSDCNYYKVGGSLEYQHPTYVVRQADEQLSEGLRNGEFCYVLNSRQMGKSSLRVQMMKQLKEQGIKCASIDMTRIGSHVTPSEWYAGVVSELLRGFGLSKKIDFSSWWRQRELLPPLQRLRDLIEDVLLVEFSQNLVIFIDEIDSIIRLKFKEDFFAFIRACYNQRVDNPEYNRLTFCLLGVATPTDLITDKNLSTPFNIGRAIELTGFELQEAQPLVQGLESVNNSQAVMAEILAWTGGQPFLTQKVCKLIANNPKPLPVGGEAMWVEQLVRLRIIENWETQDEPEHLRTIRDRLTWSGRKHKLLQLYQQILQIGAVKAKDTPEQMELRLSGVVVKQQGKLKIHNRIYASVFNKNWLGNELIEASLEVELPPSNQKVQELEQAANRALQLFESQQIEALLLAIQTVQELQGLVKNGALVQYPTVSPMFSLQIILNNFLEHNQFKDAQDGLNTRFMSARCLATSVDGTTRWDLSDAHLPQLKGHQGSVWSVSFSPDGQLIASAGRDGTARLWNLVGQALAKLDGHQGSVWNVSFSPDGLYIVTTGRDGTARLWNLAGQALAKLGGHRGWVTRVVFSPDGQRLATVGRDGTARLWDLSGQLISKVTPHQGWVWSVSFSPDGQLIATVGLDAVAPLLDSSGRMIVQLKGDKNALPSVMPLGLIAHSSFSPDGKYLVTASSDDGKARLWNIFGQQIAELDSPQDWVLCVSFSPDGQVFATADENGNICLWDLLGRQVARFQGKQGAIYGMNFSPDGQVLATAGQNGTVRLWRVEGLEQLLARGCDWLKDFFVTHPDALEKLEACQLSNYINYIEVGKIPTPTTKSESDFLGEFLVKGKLVKIYQGDITNLVTDVIVSSDDTYLKMSGGVSLRIHEVGGDDIYQETRNLIPLSLGNIAVTSAGKLQARSIFHGVVIDWHNEILPNEDIIQQVIQECLEKADANNFLRIAFPLLGTGGGGFPTKLCWEITLRQIIKELSTKPHNVSEVIIALLEEETAEEVKAKMSLAKIEKLGWKSFL